MAASCGEVGSIFVDGDRVATYDVLSCLEAAEVSWTSKDNKVRAVQTSGASERQRGVGLWVRNPRERWSQDYVPGGRLKSLSWQVVGELDCRSSVERQGRP